MERGVDLMFVVNLCIGIFDKKILNLNFMINVIFFLIKLN